MTFQEAFAELGIAVDASADQARRAYLRLLKTRKPEVDPEGFMRLREAYEIVKGTLEAREAFQRAFVEIPAPAASEPVASEPVASEPVVLEEPAAEEAEAGDDAPSEDAADVSLEEDEHEAAALARRFDAAASAVDGPPPPLGTAMRLLLRLHEQCELEPAAALYRSVVAWLRASGQEARLLRGEAAAVWTLVRELHALPTTFSRFVRAAIARGALAGDLGKTRTEIEDLRFRKPEVAERAAMKLRRTAPVLAQQFADVLDPPAVHHVPPRRSSGFGGWGGWTAGAFVILNLVRLLATSSTTSPPPRFAPPRTQPRPSFVLDAGTFDAGRHPARGTGERGRSEQP